MIREIILDTETTGLDPKSGHKIIEIGAVEMVNKVATGNIFHQYINPEREVPYEAFQIHGISTDYLKDKPKFLDIADDFLEFITNSRLIIHNASFDIGFLNHELMLINKPLVSFEIVIDTLMIARKTYPGQKNNLDALCKRYGIDNSDRKYHGALKDAYLLSEVYVELTGGRQKKFEISTSGKSKDNEVQNSKKNYQNMFFPVIEPSSDEIENWNNFRKNNNFK